MAEETGTATATCRRELDLEIPADVVTKKTESVAKRILEARAGAWLPSGQSAGRADPQALRRRDQRRGTAIARSRDGREGRRRTAQKLTPVSQPQVEKLDVTEGQPVKFRAVFEVLPEFELGNYKDLDIEMPPMDITDDDVTKTLEEMRQRAAAFAPVEGRACCRTTTTSN